MKKLLVTLFLLLTLSLAQKDLSTAGSSYVLVNFTSSPTGAEVYIAETFIGRTPIEVQIDVNTTISYRLRIPDLDYNDYYGSLNLADNDTIFITLPYKGSKGSSAISSQKDEMQSPSDSIQSYSDPIRQYMVVNNVSYYVASDDLGYTNDEALNILGLDMFETQSLGFIWVDCINPFVFIQGSAEEIGLEIDDLESYLKLRLRNDLGFLEICRPDDYADKISLSIYVNVWTVGNDYPVAFHIEFYTSILAPSVPYFHSKPFETDMLGYASSEKIYEQVTDSIEELVKATAIAYIKAVGQ